MATVTDEQPVPTVLDRLTAAGLSPSRIELHTAAGRVTVDSEVVTDAHTPAPSGTRIVITA
jgi:hypothetical protein